MLIPILYLKGISTGDFEEALAAMGEAPEMPDEEDPHWGIRNLSEKGYVLRRGIYVTDRRCC